ncbi:hypothetical protein [Microbacterium sp. GXS0129]|uniref:hypothetical protein n=1 Tax=Microbacterium sp. GXS0129 TaxID=3377836 RepID=UPI003839D285
MHSYPTGGAPTERVFRQSQTRKIISAIFVIAILAVLAFLFIPKFLPNTMTHALRFTVAGALVAVVAFLMLGSALVWTNMRVVVTPTTVEVRRPGKVLHTWDRSVTGFSTHIVKHSTNGIPTNTERSLIAHYPGGETKVTFNAMSRNAFNEMYALLTAESRAAMAQAEAQAMAATGQPVVDAAAAPLPQQFAAAQGMAAAGLPRTFEVNLAPMRKRGRMALIVAAVVAVIAAGLTYIGLQSPDDFGLLMGAFIAWLVAVVCVLVWLGTETEGRKYPKVTEVSAGGITIDGTVYPYSGLSRIWLTPETYQQRRLQLVGPTGVRKKYSYGAATAKPDVQPMPQWAELVRALQVATAHNPGLVSFDLN